MQPADSPERRARALLVAYACHPHRGSEGGTGWNRALEAARFLDTWVICEEHEFGSSVRRYLDQHGPIPGLQFHFVPQRPWESLLWHVPGLGYVAYNLWQRRAMRAAVRLHEEHHFDLVHQVNFSSYREPGYLWKLDVPFVWGPFGGTQNFPWRFLGRAGLGSALVESLRIACNDLQLRLSPRVRRAARRAAVLVAANSHTQRAFARVHGVQPLLMADTGVRPPAAACSASKTRDPTGPLRILWVGELEHRKGLGLLLDALPRLPADIAYQLRVVGDGRRSRAWQRLVRRRGLDQHVTWTGRLPHDQALEQYPWADVFVFSSLRDNLGTVILEALGAGLPVICLDHQGAHDVVTDQCGIKIPVTTPQRVIDQLAQALARLARDPVERERLGRGALERSQQYLWSRLGDDMAAVYRRALGKTLNSAATVSSDAAAAGPAAHAPANRWIELRRRAAANVAVPLRALLGSRARQQFGILLYHRVIEPVDARRIPPWSVTRQRFRQQMEGLLAHGYTPWPLRQVIEYHAAGRPVPARVFVVTFDDGYQCLYHEAWPILKQLGIPSTVFLVTAYLDSDRVLPFNDCRGDGSQPIPRAWQRSLSARQCEEMLSSGLVELGSHSHTHLDFQQHPELLRSELDTSLQILRERFHLRDAAFAFPFGAYAPSLATEVQDAGALCALTTHHELVSHRRSPFGWGRLSVERYDTSATLAAKLDGWYSLAQTLWRQWRNGVSRSVAVQP